MLVIHTLCLKAVQSNRIICCVLFSIEQTRPFIFFNAPIPDSISECAGGMDVISPKEYGGKS